MAKKNSIDDRDLVTISGGGGENSHVQANTDEHFRDPVSPLPPARPGKGGSADAPVSDSDPGNAKKSLV